MTKDNISQAAEQGIDAGKVIENLLQQIASQAQQIAVLNAVIDSMKKE